jgi:CheY-like chemotaxis protein
MLDIDMALQQHPALILTDNMMPIMTGVEMVTKLRDDPWGKKAPVILMTSMYSGDALNDSLQAGVTDFVMKNDFSVDKVVALVKGRLEADKK